MKNALSRIVKNAGAHNDEAAYQRLMKNALSRIMGKGKE